MPGADQPLDKLVVLQQCERRRILALDFKAVNDRCGHPVGDAVLRRFAAITIAALRATDRLGRWGGEEFLLLLPATRQDGGLVIAERVRAAVESGPGICWRPNCG